MSARRASPASVAAEIRRALKDGGSASHAKGVQWFFKEEIKSHGWYTADLRRVAGISRRGMAQKQGMEFVVSVADKLYCGRNLEEKVFAVFLLEKQTKLLEMRNSSSSRRGSTASPAGRIMTPLCTM